MSKASAIIIGGIVFLFGACVSDSNVDPLSELTKNQAQKQIQKSDIQISDEEFYALVQSIPSPLQAAAIMEGIGIPFDEGVVQNTEKADSYSGWFSQATNMGIYGADMGYANVYGEVKQSLDYVGSIRTLADKLKVGQFFDIATIRDLAQKSDDVDALTNASQMNFQKMNDYLQKQNRGKVSVAMILGGWVEGLYLTATVADNNADSDVLREIVAEQKLALESISLLLNLYASDEHFASFATSFQLLEAAFEGIEMIYHEGEITQYEDENGNLIVEDSSTTEIVVTQEDVSAIQQEISAIRQQLINSK